MRSRSRPKMRSSRGRLTAYAVGKVPAGEPTGDAAAVRREQARRQDALARLGGGTDPAAADFYVTTPVPSRSARHRAARAVRRRHGRRRAVDRATVVGDYRSRRAGWPSGLPRCRPRRAGGLELRPGRARPGGRHPAAGREPYRRPAVRGLGTVDQPAGGRLAARVRRARGHRGQQPRADVDRRSHHYASRNLAAAGRRLVHHRGRVQPAAAR